MKGRETINYFEAGSVILNWIYPRRCPICDRPAKPYGALICPECREKLVYVTGPRCIRCGKSVKEEEEYCPDCRRRPHSYDQGLALYEYRALRTSLYRFKYAGRCDYAKFYGYDLAAMLGREIRNWKAEALIPVPLHKGRERERGYNQAELLAKAVSEYLGIPVYSNLVIRRRKTVPQKTLNVRDRQNNLKKAFKICANDVKLKTIIIVDDIYTTGSTIDSIALEFKKAGVCEVYFIALSIGEAMLS